MGPGAWDDADGCCRLRRELRDPSVAERGNNIVHWSEFDRGGHFAAMETPNLLVEDIRTTCPPEEFDLVAFLAQSLIARVATNGPTIRPVWYLWEEEAFWWLTGSWSKLPDLFQRDSGVALLIDTWKPETGEMLPLIATGRVTGTRAGPGETYRVD